MPPFYFLQKLSKFIQADWPIHVPVIYKSTDCNKHELSGVHNTNEPCSETVPLIKPVAKEWINEPYEIALCSPWKC